MLKRKIAFILYSLEGGGVERVVLNLALSFTKKGYLVDLLVVNYKGEFLNHVPENVRVFDLNKKNIRSCFLPIRTYLLTERPDVLISAKDYINIVMILIRLVTKVSTKLIISTHTNVTEQLRFAPKKTKRIIRLMSLLYRFADKVVCVSTGAANEVKKITKLANKDIRVIYNPVVTADFLEEANKEVSHPWFSGEHLVLITVGRLEVAKDYPTLLKAFKRVKDTLEDAKLIIIGDGPDKESLIRLSKDLGLEHDVSFLGFIDKPYSYIKQAHVFILSSAWEGFGNVLVEALAVGTPVVSTDCPSGPSEILKEGEFGRLVPVGDELSLAKAIILTIGESPNRAKLIGRANDFTIEKSFNQYEKLVNDVVV